MGIVMVYDVSLSVSIKCNVYCWEGLSLLLEGCPLIFGFDVVGFRNHDKTVPSLLRIAKVTPIFQKGERYSFNNH